MTEIDTPTVSPKQPDTGDGCHRIAPVGPFIPRGGYLVFNAATVPQLARYCRS